MHTAARLHLILISKFMFQVLSSSKFFLVLSSKNCQVILQDRRQVEGKFYHVIRGCALLQGDCAAPPVTGSMEGDPVRACHLRFNGAPSDGLKLEAVTTYDGSISNQGSQTKWRAWLSNLVLTNLQPTSTARATGITWFGTRMWLTNVRIQDFEDYGVWTRDTAVYMNGAPRRLALSDMPPAGTLYLVLPPVVARKLVACSPAPSCVCRGYYDVTGVMMMSLMRISHCGTWALQCIRSG